MIETTTLIVPRPFFVRWLPATASGLLTKVGFSLTFGLAFLLLHYAAGVISGRQADWSWLLAMLLVVASLCVFYATHVLWNLFEEMTYRLGGDDSFLSRARAFLTDRRFVCMGFVFGFANCAFGASFGIPEQYESLAFVTILLGYFGAGFVCGLGLCGIYGVLLAVSGFARALTSPPPGALGLDYRAPDRCGGISFVGEAVTAFASVTLITGIMISVYILTESWSTLAGSEWSWRKSVWIGWPYLATAIVFLGPIAEIHVVLRQYKRKVDRFLQMDLATSLRESMDPGVDKAQREVLHARLSQLTELRSDLHRMRTWPVGWVLGLKGLVVAGANLALSIATA